MYIKETAAGKLDNTKAMVPNSWVIAHQGNIDSWLETIYHFSFAFPVSREFLYIH
jgi:hypothetical protein